MIKVYDLYQKYQIYKKIIDYIFRYLGRQKGGYYTREDIGTVGARDPDTAVLNGVTGRPIYNLINSKSILF